MYTHRGDKGETDLIGGARVRKNDARVEAFGSIDELNSVLGVIVATTKDKSLTSSLKGVQRTLFVAGADAAAGLDNSRVPRVTSGDTERLDGLIKETLAELPTLRNFILPGGSTSGAWLHLASTVCRRAERRLVAASRKQAMNPELLAYFNALSKYLFNLARLTNFRAGTGEEVWKSTPGSRRRS